MFDESPNLYGELGAVLYDIGRQPRVAHDFFVKYQDRIIFGKDSYQPDEYPYYWRVFETNDEYFDYYRDYHAFWKLYGIGLPDAVLKKIYYANALRITPEPPAHRLSGQLTAGLGLCRSERHEPLPRYRRRRVHRIAPAKNSCAADTQVRVLDNLSTGKRRNLEHIPGVEFIEGDLADLDACVRAVQGIDYVLHQAAIPSVPRSVKDPVTSNRANIDGSLNILVAARDAGVKRLVYAGSSSAYGDTPTLPKREDMPTRPLSPYALQKLVAEQYCQMFTRAVRPRDRDDPLLQRVRAAAGSGLAVLGRDLAVLDGAARGTAADHLRRRRADARLHLRRERRRRRAARVRGARTPRAR